MSKISIDEMARTLTPADIEKIKVRQEEMKAEDFRKDLERFSVQEAARKAVQGMVMLQAFGLSVADYDWRDGRVVAVELERFDEKAWINL
jgi:hypothetical protein